MRYAIVASGPSLRGVQLDIPEAVTVIAVNRAIVHIPRADIWFTSDPTGHNIEILERRMEWPDTEFVVAVHQGEMLPYERLTYVTKIVRAWTYGSTPTSVGNPRLCETPGMIHHGNSAWGALQLAVQRGATRVALLGVDATQDGYAWGGGSPRSLAHLPVLFRSAIPQLEARGVRVVNGSPCSRIDCFPRCTPQDALDWLRNGDRAEGLHA